ncbi:MAG TPA: hypothetical protein VLA64_11260 [Azonexus sp.]|nr:hypothetical protein [Azonexus sp.]
MSAFVVVVENGMGRYQQAVIVSQHQLITDAPEIIGPACVSAGSKLPTNALFTACFQHR